MTAPIAFLVTGAVLLAAWAIPAVLVWVLGYVVALIERGHDNPAKAHDLTRAWANGSQEARAIRLERNDQ